MSTETQVFCTKLWALCRPWLPPPLHGQKNTGYLHINSLNLNRGSPLETQTCQDPVHLLHVKSVSLARVGGPWRKGHVTQSPCGAQHGARLCPRSMTSRTLHPRPSCPQVSPGGQDTSHHGAGGYREGKFWGSQGTVHSLKAQPLSSRPRVCWAEATVQTMARFTSHFSLGSGLFKNYFCNTFVSISSDLGQVCR